MRTISALATTVLLTSTSMAAGTVAVPTIERPSVICHFAQSPKGEAMLRKFKALRFERLDTDGDGVVSRDEYMSTTLAAHRPHYLARLVLLAGMKGCGAGGG